jgi:hypothetical protein
MTKQAAIAHHDLEPNNLFALPRTAFCEVTLNADVTIDRSDFDRFEGLGGVIKTRGFSITFVGDAPSAPRAHRRGDIRRAIRNAG